MSSLNLAFAFTAGMLATVNPCGWAMLPSFIAWHLGVDEPDFAARAPATRLLRGAAAGALVTLGFLTVFAVTGTAITLGARFLVRYLPLGAIVIGALLTLLGLRMLFGGKAPFALPLLSPRKAGAPQGMFTFGLAYGLVSLSCTLPVFLVVVGMSIPQNAWPNTALMFAAFGAGITLVLAAVSISLALFRQEVRRAARALLPHIHRLSAALLVLAGLYLLWYQGRYLPVILGR